MIDSTNLARRAALLGIGGLALIPLRSAAFDTRDPTLWTRPRTLRLFNAHTAQRDEFVYWRDGSAVMAEYEAIAKFCRDHHSGEAKFISVRTLNLLYAAQEWVRNVTAAPAQTTLTSAYRTDETNDKIGGDPSSYHPAGRALDGRMDNIGVGTFARILAHFNAGGVGEYTHHIHWDDGTVRRWKK